MHEKGTNDSLIRIYVGEDDGQLQLALQSEVSDEATFLRGMAELLIDVIQEPIRSVKEVRGDKGMGRLYVNRNDSVHRLLKMAMDITMRLRNIKCAEVQEHVVYTTGNVILPAVTFSYPSYDEEEDDKKKVA